MIIASLGVEAGDEPSAWAFGDWRSLTSGWTRPLPERIHHNRHFNREMCVVRMTGPPTGDGAVDETQTPSLNPADNAPGYPCILPSVPGSLSSVFGDKSETDVFPFCALEKVSCRDADLRTRKDMTCKNLRYGD